MYYIQNGFDEPALLVTVFVFMGTGLQRETFPIVAPDEQFRMVELPGETLRLPCGKFTCRQVLDNIY